MNGVRGFVVLPRCAILFSIFRHSMITVFTEGDSFFVRMVKSDCFDHDGDVMVRMRRCRMNKNGLVESRTRVSQVWENRAVILRLRLNEVFLGVENG